MSEYARSVHLAEINRLQSERDEAIRSVEYLDDQLGALTMEHRDALAWIEQLRDTVRSLLDRGVDLGELAERGRAANARRVLAGYVKPPEGK